MAKATRPPVDFDRLTGAMRRSRMVLRKYREERTAAVREYVGHHYSEESTEHQVPVNMIKLFCKIMLRKLVARNPRVMLATYDKANKAAVNAMEQWCNEQIVKMRMADTLQRVVLDALFSVGICKVALASPADAATRSWNLQAGQPYIDHVDLDDFVVDVHARTFNEVSYIGHRYRAPLDVVKALKMYGPDRKDLTASTDPLFNQEGDERVSTIGRTTLAGADTEEFEEHVDLWEVYLPRSRQVVTFPDDWLTGGSMVADQKPLRRQEWIGHDHGPYSILAFDLVPGNLMASAPVMDLIDLHRAINNGWRKLIRQCQRQKEVTVVSGGADADGKRVVAANDGDMIKVDTPENMRTILFGGPNQQLFALVMAMKDLFSFMAGNLDIMGGLGPQSKTASQDQMLNQNSSSAVADLQDVTITFTGEVMQKLCWYWHHHPTAVMAVHHSLPGLPDIGIKRTVTPQQRAQVSFDDLSVQLNPYSLQRQTPESTMAAIMAVVSQIIVPLQPQLMQQGIQFDINAFLAKIAKFQNIADLADIVSIAEPPAAEGEPMGSGGGGPATTTRNYVRQSMPGRTQQGNDRNLVSTLLGANPGGAGKNGTPQEPGG